MTDLEARLVRLRLLLHSEAPSSINTHAAPVLRDFEGIPERQTDEGGIGLPFTAAMHRYLSGPDSWGTSRLGMLSIIAVSDWCASVHPPHRRPMFTRALCAELTFEAAYLNQEMIDLLWLHRDLNEAQVTGMLQAALSYAEAWRTDKFSRWTKEPGDDAPLPERRPFKPAAV